MLLSLSGNTVISGRLRPVLNDAVNQAESVNHGDNFFFGNPCRFKTQLFTTPHDLLASLLPASLLLATSAQAVDVIVAYQTSAEPAKVAQADNSFAKLSGANADWRKFDSGSSVVRALASGDVQIGNIGSSPLAVAASQNVPIEVFLLASQLGSSEALVVKKRSKRHRI